MGGSQPNGTPHVNGTVHQTDGQVKNMSSYAAKHKLPAHFIGGNHLAAAPAGSVKDFIASSDGHTVITSVSLRTTEESRASLTHASE